METASLRAKGLTATVTRRWLIEDISMFIVDDFSAQIKTGWVKVTEHETGPPDIYWEWLDEDGDVIPTLDRRRWLVWMQEHLAPAIESNYLSVCVLNELMRSLLSEGVTTDQAKANGSPF